MKRRKIPLIVSGAWQLVRFALISISGILFLNPTLLVGRSVLLVWPAAGSLTFFVLYLIAGLDYDRYSGLRRILLFGKVLDVVPGLFLLGLQGGALYFGIARPVFDDVQLIDRLTGYTVATELVFYYGLAAVVLLDLIFLLVLLSCRLEPEHQEIAAGENLPELEITEIEED